jgi:hypothetical protein
MYCAIKRLSMFALVTAVSLWVLPSDWVAAAGASSRPCKAYLDTRSRNVDVEINNCPVAVGTFLIRGTFANSNVQVSFGAWEARVLLRQICLGIAPPHAGLNAAQGRSRKTPFPLGRGELGKVAEAGG